MFRLVIGSDWFRFKTKAVLIFLLGKKNTRFFFLRHKFPHPKKEIQFYSFYWRCIVKCKPRQNSQPLKQHNINGVLIWKWYYTNHNIPSQQLWNSLSLTLLVKRWFEIVSLKVLIPINWLINPRIFM